MKLKTYLLLMFVVVSQWIWVVVFNGLNSIHGIPWFTQIMAERATSGFMLGLVCAGWFLTLERIDSKKSEQAIENAKTREIMMGIISRKATQDDQIIE